MFEAVMRIRCTEGTHTLLHLFLLIFLVHMYTCHSLSLPTYLIPLSHHWFTYLPHPPLSHHWLTYLPHTPLFTYLPLPISLLLLLVLILLIHLSQGPLSLLLLLVLLLLNHPLGRLILFLLFQLTLLPPLTQSSFTQTPLTPHWNSSSLNWNIY